VPALPQGVDPPEQLVDVFIPNVPVNSITDALIAIEFFDGRVGFNDRDRLTTLVLGLRSVRDEALRG
jgi:hypothetical protein